MNNAVAESSRDANKAIPIPFEREGELGVWSIEEIGPDGEIYQMIFMGPEAKERCEEYAAFKYGRQ